MAKDRLSLKEVRNIVVAAILISLGIGFTTIIAQSFQDIYNHGIFYFFIMFIAMTVIWAGIIFILVIYSKLFRKFFLRWFAINDDVEQTQLLSEVLAEQQRTNQYLLNLEKQLEAEKNNSKRDSDSKT